MKYRVISCGTASNLATYVTKAMDEGWKLVGGVCVIVDASSPTGHIYSQALTK